MTHPVLGWTFAVVTGINVLSLTLGQPHGQRPPETETGFATRKLVELASAVLTGLVAYYLITGA